MCSSFCKYEDKFYFLGSSSWSGYKSKNEIAEIVKSDKNNRQKVFGQKNRIDSRRLRIIY